MKSAICGGNAIISDHTLAVAARILNRRGELLTPDCVHAIECSFFELDSSGIERGRPVAAFDGTELDVRTVILDVPQVDDAWAVDCVGYNFRHVLTLSGVNALFERRRARYAIHYIFTLSSGEAVLVRFHIKRVKS